MTLKMWFNINNSTSLHNDKKIQVFGKKTRSDKCNKWKLYHKQNDAPDSKLVNLVESSNRLQ